MPAAPWRAALAFAAAGCTLLTATPPRVEVRSVELRGVGLLAQEFAVELCVSNPNDAAFNFRGVTAVVDEEGSPWRKGRARLPCCFHPDRSRWCRSRS